MLAGGAYKHVHVVMQCHPALSVLNPFRGSKIQIAGSCFACQDLNFHVWMQLITLPMHWRLIFRGRIIEYYGRPFPSVLRSPMHSHFFPCGHSSGDEGAALATAIYDCVNVCTSIQLSLTLSAKLMVWVFVCHRSSGVWRLGIRRPSIVSIHKLYRNYLRTY